MGYAVIQIQISGCDASFVRKCNDGGRNSNGKVFLEKLKFPACRKIGVSYAWRLTNICEMIAVCGHLVVLAVHNG